MSLQECSLVLNSAYFECREKNVSCIFSLSDVFMRLFYVI